MNEAKDLRDIKEFATGNKIRDLILKEMNPTVTKYPRVNSGSWKSAIKFDSKCVPSNNNIRMCSGSKLKRRVWKIVSNS